MGNQKWTIQRNWQQMGTQDEDKQNYNTICVVHHYTQTNTNMVNETWALLQTTLKSPESQEHVICVIVKRMMTNFIYLFTVLKTKRTFFLKY